MPSAPPPIARIRLARSVPRLLTVPLVVVVAGGAALAAALLLDTGPAQVALAVLGAAVVVGGLIGALLLLSVRLEVAESAVSLTWLGGRRSYPLVPGPVTRVRLLGPNASRLRPRSGALGWGIGRARLRDEEEIELVRLARTPTAILVPTQRGRLAVAPADDDALLDALSRAAQARLRRESGAPIEAPPAPPAEPEPPAPAPAEAEEDDDEQPSSLTGIERALLEERLLAERQRAQAEVQAAARLAAEAGAESALLTTAESTAEPATRPWSWFRRPALRPGVGWVMVLLPTIAAGVAWFAAQEAGRLPDPGSDLARLLSLALVLAGPATSVAAIMALAWWPRLAGVVALSGLVAGACIGRFLIG